MSGAASKFAANLGERTSTAKSDHALWTRACSFEALAPVFVPVSGATVLVGRTPIMTLALTFFSVPELTATALFGGRTP